MHVSLISQIISKLVGFLQQVSSRSGLQTCEGKTGFPDIGMNRSRTFISVPVSVYNLQTVTPAALHQTLRISVVAIEHCACEKRRTTLMGLKVHTPVFFLRRRVQVMRAPIPSIKVPVPASAPAIKTIIVVPELSSCAGCASSCPA